MTKSKLLLVDDHQVVRHGIKALFANEPDIEIVGEADNGREALRLIPELEPEVVLMDISMPGLNGIEATRQLRQHYPDIKIVILSMHANEEYVFQVLQAGASGYVLKQSDSIEMVAAIRSVLAGGSFLSPPISRAVIDGYLSRAEARGQGQEPEVLTSREREVLQLLAEGNSNKEIADSLTISVKTVETHRSNMMRKLDARNKTDLVKYAIRKGWATVEP
ncbi:MAG: response regulator transcription factor [Anaerolineae bacterium]|nr:response regulator transcription factor [Anaerolineae bacterium]